MSGVQTDFEREARFKGWVPPDEYRKALKDAEQDNERLRGLNKQLTADYNALLIRSTHEREDAERERERRSRAVEDAAETFAEFAEGLRLLGHPTMAQAADVAKAAMQAALKEPAPGADPEGVGGYRAAVSSVPDEQLVNELTSVITAGDKLAEAAHHVQANFDGVHRLRLALAHWYEVRANEWGRGGGARRTQAD